MFSNFSMNYDNATLGLGGAGDFDEPDLSLFSAIDDAGQPEQVLRNAAKSIFQLANDSHGSSLFGSSGSAGWLRPGVGDVSRIL